MRKSPFFALAGALALLAAACGQGPEYADLVPRADNLAVRFTEDLANRNYHRAYRQAARELQSEMSVEQMIHRFEQVVPPDLVIYSSVEIARTLNGWTGREVGDIAWYEMRIPGPEHYDGTITFTVTHEDEELRIRALEFGRP